MRRDIPGTRRRLVGRLTGGGLFAESPPSFIDRTAFQSPAAFAYGNTPRTLHAAQSSGRGAPAHRARFWTRSSEVTVRWQNIAALFWSKARPTSWASGCSTWVPVAAATRSRTATRRRAASESVSKCPRSIREIVDAEARGAPLDEADVHGVIVAEFAAVQRPSERIVAVGAALLPARAIARGVALPVAIALLHRLRQALGALAQRFQRLALRIHRAIGVTFAKPAAGGGRGRSAP